MAISVKIVFEHSFSIRHADEGLLEPSGLTLARDGTLWTVSDDTRRLFHIDPQGALLGKIDIGNRGLEGITVDAAGHLWAVDEDSGKILHYDPETGEEILEQKVEDVDGFCAVEKWFEGNGNNGLEGIAFDPVRSEFLLLKESEPGLLIAVSDQMDRIVSVDLLDRTHGFSDNDRADRKLDFSGIGYDSLRDLFWIVSDEARRVYLFDRRRGRAVASFPLLLEDEHREVKKAEGIALDSTGTRLFVVSDKDARLYVYRVESE
jgi:uncharacterized protein YjiK